MTRATLLTSILVFVVLAAAGGEVCRGDPPVTSDVGPSQVPPTDSKPVYHPRVAEYWNSGCLTDGNGDLYWPCGEDEIEFTVAPNTLYVVHENAAYNCCPDDIVISLSVDGDVLRLTEEEILTDPCYCICCYEVTATIVDLAPGPYTVEFTWYDYDTYEYRCYVEEIVIPGNGPQPDPDKPPVTDNAGDPQLELVSRKLFSQPELADYWHSDCLETGYDPDWWPCEDDDEVILTVEGNTLDVLHTNATYNCCPDDIVISLFADGNLLVLTEEEILTDPCWCICCYEAGATVADLAPGEYVVEFWWYDYQTADYRCYVEEVVIPGGGWPGGDEPPAAIDPDGSPVGPSEVKRLPRPRVVELWNSDCLEDPGGTPDDWWPCEGDDAIELTVEGNTLHVLHTDITYNCCPDEIVISGIIEEDLVLLTEEEILTNPCDCVCCFEAGASVVDLAPGTYLVVFCWFDYQTGEERCYEEEIVIP